MNNPSALIIGCLTLILVLSGFLISSFVFQTSSSTAPEVDQGSPFGGGPIVDLTPGSSTRPDVVQGGKFINVSLSNLEKLSVRDFISDDDVIKFDDEKLGEVYYSLGSIPYVLYNAALNEEVYSRIPTSEERGFEIQYYTSTETFQIFIYREPISEVRRQMANDLLGRLGIAQNELCSVIASVRVVKSANEFYSGRNLGFPGCPGATKLPGD